MYFGVAALLFKVVIEIGSLQDRKLASSRNPCLQTVLPKKPFSTNSTTKETLVYKQYYLTPLLLYFSPTYL